MKKLVLLDNTVLTNFGLAQRADLVFEAWDYPATTQMVSAEYIVGITTSQLPAEIWNNLPVLVMTDQETAFADGLPKSLGLGERSCIAVALYRQGLLASDDRQARILAQKLGVTITGTVGMLLLCVKKNHISRREANLILKKMIYAGYHSPVTTLDSLLGDG